MLFLHKLLPILVLPLGVTLIALLAGLAFHKKILLWYAAVVLWAFSMPVVGDGLMRFVEGGTSRVPVSSIDKSDALVVLSGMMRQVDGAPLGEWGDAADRFDAGIELFKAGKAPLLLFTRGYWPWKPYEIPEGELLAKRALLLGVPQSAIRLTPKVGNTADEAAAIRTLLGSQKRIILVTSAFHMRRSILLFKKAGFAVTPFPVDYRVNNSYGSTILRFLPSAEALEQSERALRELLGWFYYWIRG